MLTPEDAQAVHRQVGTWLGSMGEKNVFVLAEHFRRGGSFEEAALWYVAAGEQAFGRSEFDAVLEISQLGIDCGALGEVLGTLNLLRAEVHSLRGQHAAAAKCAFEAMANLPENTSKWYGAAGEAALGSARCGDRKLVLDVVSKLNDISPVVDGACAKLTGLIRAALPLTYSGERAMADELLDRVEQAASGLANRDPSALGPMYSARALRGMCNGDLGAAMGAMELAASAFEKVGSLREAWEHRAAAGYMCLELGALERGEKLLGEIIRTAEEIGLEHLHAVAEHNLGPRLAESGRVEEGLRMAYAALGKFVAHGNERMEGLTHCYLASMRLLEGRLEQAETHARQGLVLLAKQPAFRAVALATLAQVLLATARIPEAREMAEEALSVRLLVDHMPEGESLVRLTYAEALWADGRADEARVAIREALDNLVERASRISDPRLRASFLNEVKVNVSILERARAWSPDAPGSVASR